MLNQISKNIFWLTLSRVGSLLLLAVAYFALFRYLKPFGSGQYQFVLSYVLLFSTVVDFGIQQFITKKISEQPERTKEYFQEFFSFEVVVSTALYILLVTIAYFSNFEPVVFSAILLAGLGMVANALCYPFMAVMAANQDIKKVSLINFLNSLVNITIIFATIIFHRYIVFLASVQIIFGILDLILYRHFIKKHLPNPQVLVAAFKLDFHLVLNILKKGWPFALLVGFSAIYNRIDVILIQSIKGFIETGYYTAAYKLFDLLNFFPAAVSFTLFPFFTSLMAKKAFGEVRENLEKYTKLMLVAALPVAFGGMVLSARLIALVAGPGFEPAANVLAILIWAPAIQFVYIPVNSLIISQLTKKAMVITGSNVVVNILGNLVLIPLYGIKAAAAMTVFSELIQGTFYFYSVRKNITEFSFVKYLIKPFFAAAVMGIVLWPVRAFPLFYSLPIGTAVYLLLLVASGYISKSDLKFLVAIFKKTPTPNN
jgi:O-antigen/teichoic acid export membrane protein